MREMLDFKNETPLVVRRRPSRAQQARGGGRGARVRGAGGPGLRGEFRGERSPTASQVAGV